MWRVERRASVQPVATPALDGLAGIEPASRDHVIALRLHRNVTIHWFVDRRTTHVQRPYAELIAGYDRAENDPYSEGAIDELFSAAEAEAFVDWLKDNRGATGEDTTVDEAALPISRNLMCLACSSISHVVQ